MVKTTWVFQLQSSWKDKFNVIVPNLTVHIFQGKDGIILRSVLNKCVRFRPFNGFILHKLHCHRLQIKGYVKGYYKTSNFSLFFEQWGKTYLPSAISPKSENSFCKVASLMECPKSESQNSQPVLQRRLNKKKQTRPVRLWEVWRSH